MVQITKYSEKRMYTGTFNCQRMVCHIHDCVIQMLQLIYYVGEYTIQVRYVVDYIGFCKKLSLWTRRDNGNANVEKRSERNDIDRYNGNADVETKSVKNGNSLDKSPNGKSRKDVQQAAGAGENNMNNLKLLKNKQLLPNIY